MKRSISLFTLLVLLGTGLKSYGGDVYQALDAGDVFVATITRVEDKGATNAAPPQVWFTVHEVLRGKKDVARSPAVWSPPYHGIDYGDDDLPELRLWNATPLPGPKVGEKFILGGTVFDQVNDGKKVTKYGLFAFVRIPFSKLAREQTIEQLKAAEAARRQQAAEQAAAARERAERGTIWRAALDFDTIDKRTRQAEAVAVGRMISDSTFEIERMLKGRPRMSSGDKYFIALPKDAFDPRIADLVKESRPKCVLFLSEENLIASVAQVEAQLVDPYEGIVIADAAVIEAVAASLKKHAPPAPRPVLVISALDRDDAAPLAKAARPDWEVVLSHQFSSHGEHAVQHVRTTIPFARCLVMIDRGRQPLVRAVWIERETATTIYEATWSDSTDKKQIKALLAAVAKHVDSDN